MIHLHCHDEFSQLDGFGSAEAYVKQAKKLGQTALALTNHGNIDGLVKFQNACKKEGIKPIHGCELYIVPDEFLKQKGEKRGHITVLVKNEIGWKNLCRILTIASVDGFYYRPRIGFNSFLANCRGLVVMTGCTASFLNLEGGENFLYDLSHAADDLYLELMPHRLEEQVSLNQDILACSQETGILIVATNDCHYILPGDCEAQEVLLAIQTKAKWSDPDRYKFNIRGLHLRTEEEMRRAFLAQKVLTEQEIDLALSATHEIADLCQFIIPKRDISLPVAYEDQGEDFLLDMALDRLGDIAGKKNWPEEMQNTYYNRLMEEWQIIKGKGFGPYFAIIRELVDWCVKNDILVGPGRGSVGGSLLAYALGITKVDPIQYGLLFSRFIAEDRLDYPDIDLDFEDRKRHLVREHLEALYGKGHIASLSTVMRMKARMCVRDVCRVFEISDSEADAFAKSIEESEDDESVLESAIKKEIGSAFNAKHPKEVKLMLALEGQCRGSGQHAAALIVSKENLLESDRCNLVMRSGETVVNWDMQDSEYVGLMKLDALGLNTLSVLNETKRLMKENKELLFLHHPESDSYFFGDGLDLAQCDEVDFDFDLIPLNDDNVYKSIYEGKTNGVFQMSTWATTNLATQIRATNINELSDIIALVRPGPLDSGLTEEYIERKTQGVPWQRKHPIYEEITANTFGIIVYQEQVMEVIYKVAGLPHTTADKIRKIIGKKRDAKEFKPYEDAFVEGCLKSHTFTEAEAREFWEALQKHARYSFNRSHSIEYAIIGYWTAWLKHYCKKEFVCASLTYGSDAKKEALIEEAHEAGISILPPRIGISEAERWVVKDEALYSPFKEVKGIGEVTARQCANGVTIRKETAPGQSGFFWPTETTAVEGKKLSQKIVKILREIGAYGDVPTVDLDKFFSFKFPGANKPTRAKTSGASAIFEKTFIQRKALKRCDGCSLKKECRAPVLPSPGVFNVAIVGEAPGYEEDEEGVGFVGRAGKVLWNEIARYELSRESFHVSNVVKCFPAETKTPTKEQIIKCSSLWLFPELKEINCKLILTFGNTGLKAFAGIESGITKMSGRSEWSKKMGAWVCYCTHPAAVLHNREKNYPPFEKGIKNFIEKIEELQ